MEVEQDKEKMVPNAVRKLISNSRKKKEWSWWREQGSGLRARH